MPKTKILVKICGVTTLDQAIRIAELGTDAIGIISVEESPRYITPENKQRIFKVLKNQYPNIERVTVVKNQSVDLIIKNFLGEANETVIQLHGDEDIYYCRELKKRMPNTAIWKAFRIRTKKDIEYIKSFEKYIDAILLDSWNEETYGGSGKRIEFKNLENLSFKKPWWIAGGVSIEWVDKIYEYLKPYGIDISSSVEFYPGLKDILKVEALINKVKTFNT